MARSRAAAAANGQRPMRRSAEASNNLSAVANSYSLRGATSSSDPRRR